MFSLPSPDIEGVRSTGLRVFAPLAWIVLALSVATGVARSQSGDTLQRYLESQGTSPSQAQQALQQTGLTPEEIRQRLREAGLPDTLLDRYMAVPPAGALPGAPGISPTPTFQPLFLDSTRLRELRELWPPSPPGTLEPFGYEIFRYSASAFQPLTYGPVDPEYPVGPGDELALTLWGDNQLSITLRVSREGFVMLPEAGQVLVNGLTLEEARTRIRGALSRVYSGLTPSGRRATTFMDLSLGRLRSLQVFLLGNVVRPGGYSVSSVSRVLNALYAARGPSRSGSLRDVRVMRNGKMVTSVDLYDVILGGDTSKETRLQNGDVVFVPPVGPRVALTGPVRRPGLFELKPDEGLRALIRISGGLLATADLERAQIERVVPPEQRDSLRGQDRVAIDVSLREVLGNPGHDVALMDADSVSLFAVGDHRVNTVAVGGRAVWKPGTFEHRPGMTVRDLIEAAGGLMPDAYHGRALITRTRLDSTRALVRVDVGRAMEGDPDQNLELQPLDSLAIASVWELRDRYTVTVDGAVRRPGPYEFLEGMTLADLVLKAGGLTDDAVRARAEVARVDSSTRAGRRLADTLTVALDADPGSGPGARAVPLKPHDAVFIRRDPDYTLQSLVTISGEVKFAGAYALHSRRDRISDLVRRAGGLTELAYPEAATFTRPQVGPLAINLPEVLRNPRSRFNVALEAGDELAIPRYQPVVTVEGAVRNPTSTLFRPGMRADYYIEQASGYQPNADRRNTVVIQANREVRRVGRFGGPVPNAGSRIVVPTKPGPIPGTGLKDVATILSLLASLATTIYLIQQATQ